METIKLAEAEAATKAYDSTATVRGENGVSYLISCWHDDAADAILARAANFYGQPMAEIVSTTRLWEREEKAATTVSVEIADKPSNSTAARNCRTRLPARVA